MKRNAYIATRQIEIGEVVNESMFRKERIEVAENDARRFSTPKKKNAKYVRRVVKEGEPLLVGVIRKTPPPVANLQDRREGSIGEATRMEAVRRTAHAVAGRDR